LNENYINVSPLSIYSSFREYYEDQLELITSIEDILLPKDDAANDYATSSEKRHKRTIKILTMSTLIANIVCSTLFRIPSIDYNFFFIEDSCHPQNSCCGSIKITFGHFISRRQCCRSYDQSYSHLDCSKNQESRCL
jgi:hypothetical protein